VNKSKKKQNQSSKSLFKN